jgi:hypothetical protein
MNFKAIPSSGFDLDVIGTLVKNNFLRFKLEERVADAEISAKLDKRKEKLLMTLWCSTEAVKENSKVAKIASYRRLPSADSVLNARYGGPPGSPGATLLAQHTTLVTEFAADIKLDAELYEVWSDVELFFKTNLMFTVMVEDYLLEKEDFIHLRHSAKAIFAAIKNFKEVVGKPGAVVAPPVLLAAAKVRDDAIFETCREFQHLIVLFMDYQALAPEYISLVDFSSLKGDAESTKMLEDEILGIFRQSAIEEYRRLSEEVPPSLFSYKKWEKEFLRNL